MTARDILPLLRRILREVITPVALIVAAVLFLWEEVLWVWFGRRMAGLSRIEAVARAENAIRRLTPSNALVLFVALAALVYLAKLFALWLMASGHFWDGLVLLAVLELLAAALLARTYALTAPTLRTLKWFAWAEALVLRWSKWAHDKLGVKYLREVARDAASDQPIDGEGAG